MIGCIKTDVGKVRTNNEDAFYVPPSNAGHPQLYIVADGMGGHRGGEIASRMAVDVVSTHINAHFSPKLDGQQIKAIIKDALNKANKRILNSALENREWAGMGTTVTLALFLSDKLYIGHVGDSRAYRIRAGRIELLTRDHSLVWQLMEEGKLTFEEAKIHPLKNIITKALGTEELLEPDILEFDLKKNDIILLCSDGLTNMLDDENIKTIASGANPEVAASMLIERANSLGGIDNITVGIIIAD
jgi:protein phosphatase